MSANEVQHRRRMLANALQPVLPLRLKEETASQKFSKARARTVARVFTMDAITATAKTESWVRAVTTCSSGSTRRSRCVEFEKEEEVECDVGEWGKWSPCAAGRTTRKRVPTNMEGCRMRNCLNPPIQNTEESCKPDEWQSWSKCDPSGRKHRFRKVKGTVRPGDANCNDKESMKCEKPRVCCRAFTAQCMACQEDISVDEFCAKKPSFLGCRARQCDELSILDRFVSASGSTSGHF